MPKLWARHVVYLSRNDQTGIARSMTGRSNEREGEIVVACQGSNIARDQYAAKNAGGAGLLLAWLPLKPHSEPEWLFAMVANSRRSISRPDSARRFDPLPSCSVLNRTAPAI